MDSETDFPVNQCNQRLESQLETNRNLSGSRELDLFLHSLITDPDELTGSEGSSSLKLDEVGNLLRLPVLKWKDTWHAESDLYVEQAHYTEEDLIIPEILASLSGITIHKNTHLLNKVPYPVSRPGAGTNPYCMEDPSIESVEGKGGNITLLLPINFLQAASTGQTKTDRRGFHP
jgi:hypothetical protein